MALSISIVKRTVMGDERVVVADITFDSSYPTGGETVTLGQLGLSLIDFVWAPPSEGYLLEYDYAANKLLVRTPTNAADGDAAPAAPADEVANTTNLSTLSARCMFFGH